jgi:hypothetical protein
MGARLRMPVFIWLRRHAQLIIAGAVIGTGKGEKNMIVQCPHCGHTVDLGRVTGRKPLDITVNNVYDALQLYSTVSAAAKELGCSRGYIYKILKATNIKNC